MHARRTAPRSGRPSWRRVLNSAIATLMVGATGVSIALEARADEPNVSELADVTEAPTEQQAQQVARTYNHDVLVSSSLTENTQVSALPNGSFEFVSSALPTRVEQDGVWEPIDTSLTFSSTGMWVPAASSVNVQFSAGGDGPLARIETDSGEWVTIEAPVPVLKPPVIDEATATYADVYSGVDLRLTADVMGMSEVLIIRDAAAATNPALGNVQFTITGAQINMAESGAVTATASDGSTVISPSPGWWDSSDGGTAEAPAGPSIASPVPTSVEGSVVGVNVTEIASTPGIQYPLFVDPDFKGNMFSREFVDSAYPTTSYWNNAGANDNFEHVGFINGGRSDDGRDHTTWSYWTIDTSGIAGKHILGAHFDVYEVYSSSCSARQVDLYGATPIAPGDTWQSRQSSWGGLIASKSFAHGYSSACPADSEGFDAMAEAVPAAAQRLSQVSVGLRAHDQTDWMSWKKFRGDASMTVTFNTPPEKPTDPSILNFSVNVACGSSRTSLPAFNNAGTGARTIRMQVNASDNHEGPIDVNFYLYRQDASGTLTSAYGKDAQGRDNYRNTGLQAEGYHGVDIPSGTLSDGIYVWRGQGSDFIDVGPFTDFCFFEVKNTGPTKLPVLQWSGNTPRKVGVAASVTITVDPGITPEEKSRNQYARLEYWIVSAAGRAETDPPVDGPQTTGLPPCDSIGSDADPQSPTTVRFLCIPAGAHSFTIDVAPTGTTSTLYVAGYDRAGNLGQEIESGGARRTHFLDLGQDVQSDPSAVANVHIWRPSDFAAPPSSSIPDTGGSASSTTPRQSLTVGNDAEWKYTSVAAPGSGTLPSRSYNLGFPGYVYLDRAYNGVDHRAVIESAAPPGHSIEYGLGQLLPPGSSLYDVQKHRPLYDCVYGGDHFTSNDPTCEGISQTSPAFLLGYLFKPGMLPTNITGTTLYRCVDNRGNNEHFDSVQQNCEGRVSDLNNGNGVLGILVTYRPTASTGTSSVVSTAQSFTVAAWVRADSRSGYSTAVSINGVRNSGFYLQRVGESWRFCMRSQDATDVIACAYQDNAVPDPAATGSAASRRWIFLMGVYDAVNRQVRITIGTQRAPGVSAWYQPNNAPPASGALILGSALSAGLPSNGWNGAISDVYVTQGVLSGQQINDLLYPSDT